MHRSDCGPFRRGKSEEDGNRETYLFADLDLGSRADRDPFQWSPCVHPMDADQLRDVKTLISAREGSILLVSSLRSARSMYWVDDSRLCSRACAPREMVEGVKPQWERVNTFSPGLGHSPHHRFHGAISQIRSIELLWQVAKVDESTKQKIASHVLAIWQFDGNYLRAGHYIHGLQGLTDENERGPLLRAIDALKIPEEHAEGDHLVLTLSYPNGKPMERVQGYRDGRGQFVRHGTWEIWHLGGKRECYGHFDHGMLHGPEIRLGFWMAS